MLKVSDKIPTFRAQDQEGNLVSSQDFTGVPAVIYFYPKDETSICTKEACDFRDTMDDFDVKGVLVIGISPDSPESHRNFIDHHELNFELLCDPKLEIAQKFGAVQKRQDGSLGIERATYLIDEAGMIVWMEKPVDANGHAKRVIEAVDKFFPNLPV